MATPFDSNTWEFLISRIAKKECTPFLGAGINAGILPTGAELAAEWAMEASYPFKPDLVGVAQFVAVHFDRVWAKQKLLALLKEHQDSWDEQHDFQQFVQQPGEALGVLAELPFPMYLTTNYDDLIYLALRGKGKQPHRDYCRWNIEGYSVREEQPIPDISIDKPLVFHLHGFNENVESLVLTEDDYLEFLVNIAKWEEHLVPPSVQEAMARTSLLFIGYALEDWSFRVLWKLLKPAAPGKRKGSLAVQLLPKGTDDDIKKSQEYLDKYFSKSDVLVYWGTASEFAKELGARWAAYQKKTKR
jgi:hypothetical protein